MVLIKMFITLTTSHPNPDQSRKVEAFLSKFLPRLEKQPGVVAVYHYSLPEQADDITIIIWENQQALKDYREGILVLESTAFEKDLNLPATRESYLLAYPTLPKS
jgi:quinol monooxygenase YgiN